MAEFGVRKNSLVFMSLLPLKGNPIILHTTDGWVWPDKNDCSKLPPFTGCTLTIMAKPDYNTFKMVAKGPQYYSGACKWAINKPWHTETSDWTRTK